MAVLILKERSSHEAPDQFENFYTTYNRTVLQQRVGDLLAACASARSLDPRKKVPFRVILVGHGRAGLSTLLAAPAADSVVADCDQLDAIDDEALLSPDLFCPGIRNIGSFEGPAMLAAPHPLVLHNTGSKFSTEALRSTYKTAGANAQLRIESNPLSDEDLVNWIAQMK